MTDTVKSALLKQSKGEKSFLPAFPYRFIIIIGFVFSILGLIGFFMAIKPNKSSNESNKEQMTREEQFKRQQAAQQQAQMQAVQQQQAQAQAQQQQPQQPQPQQPQPQPKEEVQLGFMQSSAAASLQCPVGAVCVLIQSTCPHCENLLKSGELNKLGEKTLVLGVSMDEAEHRQLLPQYNVNVKGFPCILFKTPKGFVELTSGRTADVLLQEMGGIMQSMQQQQQQQQQQPPQ